MASSTSDVFPPASLATPSNKLFTTLTSKSQKIAFVETACGGLLSSSLLSYPGASKIYAGGLTLYTLPSRIAYGGWTQTDINAYRGPTTKIVAGLAAKARKDLGADWVVAESGTAGPTGGDTRERTPGFCAFAVVGEKGTWVKEVETGSKDRGENMLAFAREAFGLAVEAIEGKREPDVKAEEGKL